MTRPIDRRDFLVGSGALALAAAAGVAVPAIGRQRSGAGRRGASRAAWRALAASLDGRLILPGERGFTARRLPWNLAAADRTPQGLALVESAFDVQRCVDWARDEGMPVVARSGGHSYAGFSTTTGLLVDMAALDEVDLDDEGIATVGGGGLLGPIDLRLNATGSVLPSGRCSGVGIAGLTLGGGFGFNARRFGLTCDNLVDTDIVTADGELRTVDDATEADLFWALRGGGGGNFGINTRFRFRTYRTPEVSVYSLAWDPADAVAAWAAVQAVAESAPDAFSLRLGIDISDDGPQPGAVDKHVTALGQYLGPVEELRELLDPAMTAATPLMARFETLDLADGTAFLGETQAPMAFLGKSAYLPTGLPEDLIEILVAGMDEFPTASRQGNFTLFAWGGAIGDVPADQTAFVHRDAAYVAEGCASWHPGDPASVVAATIDWQARLFERLADGFDGSAYQNFMDPSQSDPLVAYYGDNLERLIEVKSEVDPEGFFSYPRSIPTSRPPS